MRRVSKPTLVIVALAVVAGAAIWFWPTMPANPAQSVSATTGTTEQAAPIQSSPVPKVDLDKLKAPRPDPEETKRNPFRFEGTRSAPTPGGQPGPSLVPAPSPGPIMPPPPTQPPMPVGPPPIPLKFIGTVEATRRGTKLAVLSDGRDVFYGGEGDVIDGRYRIVRIGVESIEMEYLDGRGRQTIRLTG